MHDPVPVTLVRALVGAAEVVGAPGRVLAEARAATSAPRVGVPGEPGASVHVIDGGVERRFWAHMSTTRGVSDFAVAGAQALQTGALGSPEAASTTAATVLEGLRSLIASSDVLHGVPMLGLIEHPDGTLTVTYDGPHDRSTEGAKLAAEFSIVAVVQVLRRATRQPLAPRVVKLRGDAHTGLPLLARELECPVETGAPFDGFVLGPEEAAVPLFTASPLHHAIARRLVALERRALEGGTSAAAVRARLTTLVTERIGLLDAAADALGTSPRALQQRLQREGVGFRALVDEARRKEAERLLVAAVPAAEVSRRLAYADRSAFHRACVRWWGVGARAFAAARGATRAAGSRRTPEESAQSA